MPEITLPADGEKHYGNKLRGAINAINDAVDANSEALETVGGIASTAVQPGDVDGEVADAIGDEDSETREALREAVSEDVPVSSSLSRWRRKILDDPANAMMALLGDSTSNGDSGPSAPTYARLAGISKQSITVPARFHTAAGQGLAGMTADTDHFIDAGSSGIKASGILVDYHSGVTSAKSLRWVISKQPHLIRLSIGINDLRQRERTPEQLSADITEIIEIIRDECPETDILLQTPNSFLTTNYNNLNYVRESPTGAINPDGLAQTISNELRQVYLGFVNRWPNVVVADAQAAVFGMKSIAYAAGGLMSDQIHPGQAGQYAVVDYLVESFIGRYPRAELRPGTVSLGATANSPYTPWTITPAVLDDPTQFARVGAADSSTDTIAGTRQSLGPAIAGDFSAYDIVRMPDGTVYQLPSNVTISQNGPTVRFSSSLAVANQPGLVEVFRQIKTGDATMDRAVYDKSKRFRKFFRVVSATSTSVTLRPVSITADRETTTVSELSDLIAAGNTLYLAGAGSSPVTLAEGQWSASGANIVVSSLTTDYSTYTGRLAAIIGTQTTSVPGPPGPSGPAGGIAAPVISGRGAIPAVFGPRTSSAGTLGSEYAVPIVFSEAGSVSALAIDVSTAVTGAAARLGFRSSTGGLPDAVLADGGTALDCSTTGLKTATLSSAVEVEAGTVYWISVWLVGTAAANIRTINGISPLIAARSGIANDDLASITHTKGSTDGALTDWGSTYNNNGFAPLARAIMS